MRWIVFLVMLPVVTAGILPLSCTGIPIDYSECSNILSDASLSQTEKEDLYLNLLNAQTGLPNHEFIRNWNNQIQFSSPPIGVQASSNGTIQNAWLKIVGVNKSVFDLNEQKWFVQPFGQIQTARHFTTQIPSGNQPGDCKTEYAHTITQNQLTIKANGTILGNNTATDYELDLPSKSDLNFEATWSLTSQLSVAHYQTRQHSFYDGYEWHYWTQCDYINTIVTYYHLDLSDNFPTTVLKASPQIHTNFDTKAQSLQLENRSADPLNEFTLTQENKSYSHSRFRYDINQRLAPYGVLFATRTPENAVKTNFILLDKNESRPILSTLSPNNCLISIQTDFDQNQFDCNPTILTPTNLELLTDKNFFDKNETIQVTAHLRNDQNQPLTLQTIRVATKNSSQIVNTDDQGQAQIAFLANQTDGVIHAYFAGQSPYAKSSATTRTITGDSQNWITLAQLLGVFGSYYFLFLIAKTKVGAI